MEAVFKSLHKIRYRVVISCIGLVFDTCFRWNFGVGMIEVVKRKGHKEKFDERKLYGSIYAACIVSHMDEKICETVANFVSKKVKGELKSKKTINSQAISRMVVKHLKRKSKDAAFIYETHRDIS